MNESTTRTETIRRIFVAGANDALARRLDAFETEADPHRPAERAFRTLGARSITLTNDIDRGPFGVGEGLKLTEYEYALKQKIPYNHPLDLDPDAGVMMLKEGALLRVHLDLNDTDAAIINRPPMFDAQPSAGDDTDERLALYHFIPRTRMVGAAALKAAYRGVRESISAGEAALVRPRVIEPTRAGWSRMFTPLDTPGTGTRAA